MLALAYPDPSPPPPGVVGCAACLCWRKQTVEVFVTSSGTATDLETYDFDYKASDIEISAVFSEPGQSITISEVRTVLHNTYGWG